jgi:hypothetical protein
MQNREAVRFVSVCCLQFTFTGADSNTYLHDTLRVFCDDPARTAVLTDHIDFSVPGSMLVLTLLTARSHVCLPVSTSPLFLSFVDLSRSPVIIYPTYRSDTGLLTLPQCELSRLVN